MVSEEYRGARKWSRNRQAAATVVWISFLGAAVATMLFFAFFDPNDMLHLIDESANISRDAGYAVGFFFFWIITSATCGVTAWLVRTAPRRDQQG